MKSRACPEAAADVDPCYAVIGRGFAGTVNLTTLLSTEQGRARIGGRSILWIGQRDPWLEYRELLMGQWPYLLTMPGFARQPPLHPINQYLRSAHFGRAVAQQSRLLKRNGLRVIGATVSRIDQCKEGFRLFFGRRARVVERVDVCTGGGPPKLLDRGVFASSVLCEAYRRGRSSTVLSGDLFLRKRHEIQRGSLVCVVGSGGTAAWCAETALEAGCRVLWVSRRPLDEKAFPKSGRNSHLRQPRPDLVFSPYTEVERIEELEGGRIAVGLGAAASPALCDQVVLALGAAPARDPRSMPAILRAIIPAGPTSTHAIFSLSDRRLLGLQSAGGALRLLGGAAIMHPASAVLTADRKGHEEYHAYFEDLCDQAKGMPSIAMAAHNIAEANGMFEETPSRNLNSAPCAQLALAANDPSIAEIICTGRGREMYPYLAVPDTWAGLDLSLYWPSRGESRAATGASEV